MPRLNGFSRMPANNSTSAELEPTRDTLLNGQVTLWQPARGYRAAIDPVLLAATLSPRPGSRVLDLGCGAGAITFCLLARYPDIDVTGLEINPDLVALARRNTGENGASQQFQVYQGTVASPPDEIPTVSFDVVVSNPPYLESGRATVSPDAGKQMANMESDADLSAWIDAASRALKPKGRLALIHRADRLDQILALMRVGFGEITIHPLWPKAETAAKRVIVQARKGVSSPTRLLPGTVVHQADGQYTHAIRAALDGGVLNSRNSTL
jgi:tRNA1(Val) A37 N6-methylase TrmN6